MKHYHRQDYYLAVTTFILVVFGLIMVSSASIGLAQANEQSNTFYLFRQAGYAGLGLFAWWFFQNFNYRNLKRFATIMLGLSILTLLLVLVPGIGYESG